MKETQEKQKTPAKCKNDKCDYYNNGECLKFTQEQMLYNRINCEGRKY